jgi:type II secretory pathway pseudopilin PulG
MWICSAPTRIDRPSDSRSGVLPMRPGPVGRARLMAFTLVELLVVMSLMSLLILIAQVNLFGMLRRNTFKAQVQDFVSTMQMAASHAGESGQRYEMIINLAEQSYLLRELTDTDLTALPSVEQTVTEGAFRGNCRIAYVEFDDGTYTNEDKARFRAGHAGWQYGGKIVFLDESEQPYAVIVNRVTPIIQLIEGDPPLMTPKTKEQVPFL